MEDMNFSRKVEFNCNGKTLTGRIIDVKEDTYKIITAEEYGFFEVKKDKVKFLDEITFAILRHDVERMLKRLKTNESEAKPTAERLAQWCGVPYDSNHANIIKLAKEKYNV